MSSKRAIRRKSCEGKVRFDTIEGARKSIRKHGQVGMMNAYTCSFCGGFHTGHKPKQMKRAILARMYG